MTDLTKMMTRARQEYARMLRLSCANPERAYGQAYMALLRDLIATVEGRDSWEVQLDYEQRYLSVDEIEWHRLQQMYAAPPPPDFDGGQWSPPPLRRDNEDG